MAADKTYFPNLDGIRALACLGVFVGHMYDYINTRKITSSVESWLYDHEINGIGPVGVSLFFVLSGFLITWLLLAEKEKSGTISLKNFYRKRILRIWPMFFAVVIAGFFLVPLLTKTFNAAETKHHLPWFLLFSNNFDRIHSGFTGFGNDTLGVLWSVAVEEQFYLFWPILILLCSKRALPFLLLFFIAGSFCFRYFFRGSYDFIFYHTFSVAGDLAMGGLVAWLGSGRHAFREFFRQRSGLVRLAGWLIIIVVVGFHRMLLQTGTWSAPGRLLLTFAFGLLIADQSFSAGNFLQLKKVKPLVWLGWISYGFYCLHLFVIMLFQKVNAHFGITSPSNTQFFLEFAGVFIVTAIISALSYRYFEGYFLRIKNRIAG